MVSLTRLGLSNGCLHLKSGTGAVVSGVVRPDHISPLLSGLDVLPVGAGVGPSGGVLGGSGSLDEEAAVGDARIDGTRLKDVRVGPHEDVSHHGARAGADGKDTVRVSSVLLDRILDHVGNGLAVTATVVGESWERVSLVLQQMHKDGLQAVEATSKQPPPDLELG